MVAPPAGQGTEREVRCFESRLLLFFAGVSECISMLCVARTQLAFLFTNGFLMDAVRFRMQAVHRESLKKAVQTWLENQQSDLKKIYLRKMLEDKVCPHYLFCSLAMHAVQHHTCV